MSQGSDQSMRNKLFQLESNAIILNQINIFASYTGKRNTLNAYCVLKNQSFRLKERGEREEKNLIIYRWCHYSFIRNFYPSIMNTIVHKKPFLVWSLSLSLELMESLFQPSKKIESDQKSSNIAIWYQMRRIHIPKHLTPSFNFFFYLFHSSFGSNLNIILPHIFCETIANFLLLFFAALFKFMINANKSHSYSSNMEGMKRVVWAYISSIFHLNVK